jgi:hypothetical protein
MTPAATKMARRRSISRYRRERCAGKTSPDALGEGAAVLETMSGAAGDATSAMAPTPDRYLWPLMASLATERRPPDVLENSQRLPKRVRAEARPTTSYHDDKVCVLLEDFSDLGSASSGFIETSQDWSDGPPQPF